MYQTCCLSALMCCFSARLLTSAPLGCASAALQSYKIVCATAAGYRMGSCRGYLMVQVCECVSFHSCFFLSFWCCFPFELLGGLILFWGELFTCTLIYGACMWGVISPSSVCPTKSGLTVQTPRSNAGTCFSFIVKARQWIIIHLYLWY